LLAAHASFFSSLHFGFRSVRSSLHYIPRFIPFINQHKPQQRTASVAPFSTFRSCQPFVSSRPDFGDTNPQTPTNRQNIRASFRPRQFTSFRSVATLAFPDPIFSGMPCDIVAPIKKAVLKYPSMIV
jgi:hypothetical protein